MSTAFKKQSEFYEYKNKTGQKYLAVIICKTGGDIGIKIF